MHTKNQLIASLTMGNEAIDHLLAMRDYDYVLFREILEILETLEVDPHMGFGPAYSLAKKRKIIVERKIRKRLENDRSYLI